jgi:hypothetical protein
MPSSCVQQYCPFSHFTPPQITTACGDRFTGAGSGR